MSGPLIVTASFAGPDFAWLDGLRRAHFPPARNQVPAHLTLFHALPPSAESEVRTRLADMSRSAPPRATIAGLMNLGGGVAFRVASDDLDVIRDQLASAFHGLLGAQDSAGWRPHVTIQNKVPAPQARRLLVSLEAEFMPRPLHIIGLTLQRYLGGPWESLRDYRFRGP